MPEGDKPVPKPNIESTQPTTRKKRAVEAPTTAMAKARMDNPPLIPSSASATLSSDPPEKAPDPWYKTPEFAAIGMLFSLAAAAIFVVLGVDLLPKNSTS
jgi:hypothetical protein